MVNDEEARAIARRLTKKEAEALRTWPQEGLGAQRVAAYRHGLPGMSPVVHRSLFDRRLTWISNHGTKLNPLGLRVRAALVEMEDKA